MRASILLGALTVLAGAPACSSNNATSPSSQTAVFTEALSAVNEVPAATGAETSAAGNAVITLNFSEDASGNVTAATANFQVTLTGFTTSSVITMAHIHQAPVGQSGSIVVSTGITSTTVTLTNGTGSFTVNAINVPANIAQQMLTNSAAFYFNVHTAANLAGADRGQLVRTQ